MTAPPNATSPTNPPASVELPPLEQVPAVWVPSLILQPLAENAVVHGLAAHQGAVTVRIAARVTGDVLTLSVLNTIAAEKPTGEPGIGLKNVRERLAVQFEGRANLVAGSDGTQWRSELTMPAVFDSPARALRMQPARVSP